MNPGNAPNRPTAQPLLGSSRHALALELGDQAPSEIRLFRAGANPSTKGTFYFTETSAQLVMGAAALWGNEHSSDYEHQILDGGEAPASSWYELEIRQTADGPELWAVNIRWTARAKELIEAKEYRYFSPTFDTDSNGVITNYLNFALTNTPALWNLAPLIAANRLTAQALGISIDQVAQDAVARAAAHGLDAAWPVEIFTDAVIVMTNAGATYRLPYTVDADDQVTITGDPVEVKRQWIPVPSSEGATMTEADKSTTETSEAPAATTVAARVDTSTVEALSAIVPEGQDVIGTVTAWRDAAGRVEALSRQNAQLQAAAEKREIDDLLAQGEADGKVTPATRQALTETFSKGGVNVAGLRAYLAASPRLVPASSAKEPEGAGATAGDRPDTRGKKWADLTNTERHALRITDAEEFQRLYTEHKATLS